MPLTAEGRKKLEDKEKNKAFSQKQSDGRGFKNASRGQGPTVDRTYDNSMVRPNPQTKGAINRNNAFQLEKAPAGAAVLKPGVKQTKSSGAFNIPIQSRRRGKAPTDKTIANLEIFGERGGQGDDKSDLNAAREKASVKNVYKKCTVKLKKRSQSRCKSANGNGRFQED